MLSPLGSPGKHEPLEDKSSASELSVSDLKANFIKHSVFRGVHNQKRRFFVLSGRIISYYVDQQSFENGLPCKWECVLCAENSAKLSEINGTKVLVVSLAERTLRLSSLNPEDKELRKWLDHIQSVVLGLREDNARRFYQQALGDEKHSLSTQTTGRLKKDAQGPTRKIERRGILEKLSKRSGASVVWLVRNYVSLHWARRGYVIPLKRFLKSHSESVDVYNLFRAAIIHKHVALVAFFTDELKLDVNRQNKLGIPCFWFAVAWMGPQDNGSMLRFLITKGANITMQGFNGDTILFLITMLEDSYAMSLMTYLVNECGVDILKQDRFGCTVLHLAVMKGSYEIVKCACDLGGFNNSQARWTEYIDEVWNSPIIKDEHRSARKEWKFRGLAQAARAASPLAVSVLHNHLLITKLLAGITEVQTAHVKARRKSLFSHSCADFDTVVRAWPKLLPYILEMFVVDDGIQRPGYVERKYDLRLLMGKPDVPVTSTPLAIIREHGDPEVFAHRIVRLIVSLKWSLFGESKYLVELWTYVFMVLFFLFGYVFVVSNGAWVRVCSWIMALYFLIWEEGREMLTSFSSGKIHASEYFKSSWNWLSLTAYTTILILMIEELHEGFGSFNTDVISSRLLVALAVLCLMLRWTEHLAVLKSTGLLVSVIRIMLVDTAKWSALFLVFELAFGLTFYCILRGETNYENLFETLITTFSMSMGQISLPFSQDSAILNDVAALNFLFFMLTVTVIYINLLVAMMAQNYERVVRLAEAEDVLHRAEAVLKWESIMGNEERKRVYSPFSLDKEDGVRHLRARDRIFGPTIDIFISYKQVRIIEASLPGGFSRKIQDSSNLAIVKSIEEVSSSLKLLDGRIRGIEQALHIEHQLASQESGDPRQDAMPNVLSGTIGSEGPPRRQSKINAQEERTQLRAAEYTMSTGLFIHKGNDNEMLDSHVPHKTKRRSSAGQRKLVSELRARHLFNADGTSSVSSSPNRSRQPPFEQQTRQVQRRLRAESDESDEGDDISDESDDAASLASQLPRQQSLWTSIRRLLPQTSRRTSNTQMNTGRFSMQGWNNDVSLGSIDTTPPPETLVDATTTLPLPQTDTPPLLHAQGK